MIGAKEARMLWPTEVRASGIVDGMILVLDMVNNE